MMDLDEQLQAAGERWRAAERAPVVDFRRVTAKPARWTRKPRRSRALALLSVVAVVAVVIGAIALIGDDSTVPRKVTVTQPSAPIAPSVLTLDPKITQTGALAFDSGGTVWVTGSAPNGGPATLEHIESRTGKVLGTVELPDNSPFQIVVGAGAVWVASQQAEESAHVIKVDPSTMKISAVIPTAGDAAVAVTPDSVWFNVNTGVLQRRNPVTNEIEASITVPGGPYGAQWISASPEGIFLANSYDGTVWSVDQETNTLAKLADLGDSAGGIVELDGWLWINSGKTIVQVNPTTGATKRTIPLDLENLVANNISDDGSLWATLTVGSVVTRIDPRTGAVTVPHSDGAQGARALAVDPSTGAVWAAVNEPTPRVVRVAG
jgi:streptogramin lyase